MIILLCQHQQVLVGFLGFIEYELYTHVW